MGLSTFKVLTYVCTYNYKCVCVYVCIVCVERERDKETGKEGNGKWGWGGTGGKRMREFSLKTFSGWQERKKKKHHASMIADVGSYL